MSNEVKAPAGYLHLMKNIGGILPRYAKEFLVLNNWELTYGGAADQFSYALIDPTGKWVMKIAMTAFAGYNQYAEMAMQSHLPGGHLPRIDRNMLGQFGGSVTLMERLHPLQSPSMLLKKQRLIQEAVQIQEDHTSFRKRLSEGTEPVLTKLLGKNQKLFDLVLVLARVRIMTGAMMGTWKESDIMRREDGTEVLLDPFEAFTEVR